MTESSPIIETAAATDNGALVTLQILTSEPGCYFAIAFKTKDSNIILGTTSYLLQLSYYITKLLSHSTPQSLYNPNKPVLDKHREINRIETASSERLQPNPTGVNG